MDDVPNRCISTILMRWPPPANRARLSAKPESLSGLSLYAPKSGWNACQPWLAADEIAGLDRDAPRPGSGARP
jgi:hypothetical protein